MSSTLKVKHRIVCVSQDFLNINRKNGDLLFFQEDKQGCVLVYGDKSLYIVINGAINLRWMGFKKFFMLWKVVLCRRI